MKEYGVFLFTDANDFMDGFTGIAEQGWQFEAFFPQPILAALVSVDRQTYRYKHDTEAQQ